MVRSFRLGDENHGADDIGNAATEKYRRPSELARTVCAHTERTETPFNGSSELHERLLRIVSDQAKDAAHLAAQVQRLVHGRQPGTVV
jgi:hypothetical protein